MKQMNGFGDDAARWQAVVQRDHHADGVFYFSVQSTGVYCRPSCAARLALRKNVRFHATWADAERAGFRPCKRCKPTQAPLGEQHAALVAQACRQMEQSEQPPSLQALAQTAGISAFHFHRVFKAFTGVTPKAYADAHRAKRMREELPHSTTVTNAIYQAGFNSSGRFYAKSSALLGMKPKEFRAGGKNACIRFAVRECWLGSVLVAATEKGICAILLGDDPAALARDLQDRFPRAEIAGGGEQFEKTLAGVIATLESPTQEFNLPLDVRGTAFQQRVWQALRQIPVGTTASYAGVAEKIGSPKSVRAVAGACAANALAVVIPCHRVVRGDGGLSGYRWGVERKRALLKREGGSDDAKPSI